MVKFSDLQFHPNDCIPEIEIAHAGRFTVIRGPCVDGYEVWDHEEDFPKSGLTPKQVEERINE